MDTAGAELLVVKRNKPVEIALRVLSHVIFHGLDIILGSGLGHELLAQLLLEAIPLNASRASVLEEHRSAPGAVARLASVLTVVPSLNAGRLRIDEVVVGAAYIIVAAPQLRVVEVELALTTSDL